MRARPIDDDGCFFGKGGGRYCWSSEPRQEPDVTPRDRIGEYEPLATAMGLAPSELAGVDLDAVEAHLAQSHDDEEKRLLRTAAAVLMGDRLCGELPELVSWVTDADGYSWLCHRQAGHFYVDIVHALAEWPGTGNGGESASIPGTRGAPSLTEMYAFARDGFANYLSLKKRLLEQSSRNVRFTRRDDGGLRVESSGTVKMPELVRRDRIGEYGALASAMGLDPSQLAEVTLEEIEVQLRLRRNSGESAAPVRIAAANLIGDRLCAEIPDLSWAFDDQGQHFLYARRDGNYFWDICRTLVHMWPDEIDVTLPRLCELGRTRFLPGR